MRVILLFLILTLGISCKFDKTVNSVKESIGMHLTAKKQTRVCYEIIEPYDIRGIYCLEYIEGMK